MSLLRGHRKRLLVTALVVIGSLYLFYLQWYAAPRVEIDPAVAAQLRHARPEAQYLGEIFEGLALRTVDPFLYSDCKPGREKDVTDSLHVGAGRPRRRDGLRFPTGQARAEGAASSRREALPEPVAPVRQARRLGPLAAEHRVGGPRRRAPELRRRDPPHARVEPGLLEDRLGELGPRGSPPPRPRGRRRTAARRAGGSPRRGARRRSASRAGRRRPPPRPAPGPAGASSGRSSCSSARRARTSARSTRARRRPPRRGASSARSADSGSGPSDSTYGERFRPSKT